VGSLIFIRSRKYGEKKCGVNWGKVITCGPPYKIFNNYTVAFTVGLLLRNR